MKIAQVAPLTEAVPPKLYGGTERVVAYLTDALVELGHDVTLFASGDSATKATLLRDLAARTSSRPAIRITSRPCSCSSRPWRVERMSSTSSIATSTTSAIPCYGGSARHRSPPCMGGLICPNCRLFIGCTADMPVVSISDSQREPLAGSKLCRDGASRLARRICCAGARDAADTWPFWGVSPPKRRRTRRFGLRHGQAFHSKSRPRWTALIGNTSTPRWSRCSGKGGRIHRRDPRGPETGIPGQCRGSPLPDSVARTFRLGDDRGDGLRNSRHRIREWLGPRGVARRGDRLYRAQRGSGGRSRGALRHAGSSPIRGEFERRFTARHMAQNYLKVYSRLSKARQLPAVSYRSGGDELAVRLRVPGGRAMTANP